MPKKSNKSTKAEKQSLKDELCAWKALCDCIYQEIKSARKAGLGVRFDKMADIDTSFTDTGFLDARAGKREYRFHLPSSGLVAERLAILKTQKKNK